MARKVIILGAGGHAKVIGDIIIKNGDELLGFLDDNEQIQNKVIFDNKKVIGTINDCYKYPDVYFIIGIGSNKIRKAISQEYNLNWYTAIHPNAVIASDVQIGNGSVVMAGSVINTGTKIGKHCIINTSSSIDHDNILEDYVHISPGAHLAGAVTVKNGTWICAGAIVINNITIEKNNVIGAGAVVIQNINTENGTYVGIPVYKLDK